MKKSIYALLLVCTSAVTQATAQNTMPLPSTPYQIMNAVGLALGNVEGTLKIVTPDANDTNQQWNFIETNGGHYELFNIGTQEYVTMQTANDWNTWDCAFSGTLPSSVSKAQYTLEALDDTYIGIKMVYNSKYLGTDNTTDGSTVYCDKQPTNNGNWYLTALSSDASIAYASYSSRITHLLDSCFNEYPNIFYDITDSLTLYEEKYSLSDETYEQGIVTLQLLLKKLEKASNSISDLMAQMLEAEQLLQTTEYPAHTELQATYDTFVTLIDNASMGMDELIAAPSTMAAAILHYQLSQTSLASVENPADLTFLIQHPSFREEKDYSDDCTITSTGWNTRSANLPESGSDIGAKRKGSDECGKDISCFNCWSWQYTVMEVYQELAQLPAGQYKLSCIGWTSDGSVLNQQAFATSNTGITVTSNKATAAMSSTDWEMFLTDPISVMDGYLKIGFTSAKETADGSEGWFLVTDFKLYYLGAASDDALQNDLNKRIEEAETLNVPLKGDAKVLQSAINEAKAAIGAEAIKNAIDMLNSAIAVAQNSISQSATFQTDSYQQLQAQMESVSDADQKGILQALLLRADELLVADTTTQNALPQWEELFSAYLSYSTIYTERVTGCLENAVLYHTNAVDALKTLLRQQTTLLAGNCTATTVSEQKAQLSIAVDNVLITQAAGENTSMSFLIHNADATDGGDKWLSYWNVSLGTGNKYTNKSESFTGNSNDRYIDSYNSTAGTLVFTASQQVDNLPNGTYRMEAAVRADGENAYIYAINSGDVLYKKLIPSYGNSGGEIYDKAYDEAYQAELASGKTESEIDPAYIQVNVASKGWSWAIINGIEVKNHTLTIGVSTDSEITQETAFTGTWFSADKFSLYYTAAGDNSDFNYDTYIEEANKENKPYVSVHNRRIIVTGDADYRIYTIDGRQIAIDTPLNLGLYIVRTAQGSEKVKIQ